MPRGSRLPFVSGLAAGLALLVGALVGEFQVWPDWDATWLLAIARRLHDGATLYSRDLIEVNPPMVVDLARLALAGSRVSGVTAVTAWRLLVCVLEVLSLACALRFVRRLTDAPVDWFFLPAAAAVTVALACLPGIDFGQREHVILLFSLPYVLAAAVYADRGVVARGWRIATGLMMAVALSIKPHYVLLLLCVEVGLMVRVSSVRAMIRIESVSTILTAVALTAALLWRYPGYLATALPFALRYYRDYVGLQLAPSHAVYLGAAVAAVAATRWTGVRSAAPALLLWAGAGAYLALLAQGKGWSYHFVPARSLLFACVAVATVYIGRALLRGRAHWTPRWSNRLVIGATLLAMVGLGGLMARRTVNINRGPWPQRFAELRQILERERRPDVPLSMATLSLELFPAFPVVEVLGGTWASRYSCLWTIPAIEAHEREGTSGAPGGVSERARLIAEVGEDLANFRPTVILVEEFRSPVLDAVVAAAPVRDVLQSYRLAGHVGPLAVWLADRP